MYWLEWIENNRWMRWNVRLLAAVFVVAAMYRGVKWLVHALC